MSPADTDILLVAAPADVAQPAQLSDLAERVWVGVAAPRVQLTVTDPARVRPDLLEARNRLAEPSSQRSSRPDADEDGGSPHDVPPVHGGMTAMAGTDHGGMAGMAGMDHGGGSADITLIRNSGNKILGGIVNVLFGTKFTDLCYGYNAFWRSCLPHMHVTCDGFEVETLINVRVARAGLNVTDHLEVGEPADIIQSLSNQLGADLVIVGHSRQKAFALRWWRGSIDAVLLEKIRCSLLVAAGPRQPG